MATYFRTSVVAAGVTLATACSQPSDSAGDASKNEVTPKSSVLAATFRPEPPGGCGTATTTGACGAEGKGRPACAGSADQCRGGEIYIPDYPGCRVNHTCTVEKIVGGREGRFMVEINEFPSKGGDAKDVSSADPPCDPTASDASRCHWDCIDAPTGTKIDVSRVSFSAKEGGDRSFDWDDPHAPYNQQGNPTWGECPTNGGDCPIGWSKWEVVQIAEDHVCGRFKNWSHDRKRLAKIHVRLLP